MATSRLVAASWTVASILAVGTAIVACTTSMTATGGTMWARESRSAELPLGAESVARLARVGITPESLAAVGATPEQGEASFTLTRAYLDGDNRLAFRELELQRAAAAKANDRRNLALIEADLAALHNQLFAIAVAPLDEPARAALGRVRGNMAWPVPVKFKAADLTKRQWITLRDVYAAAKTHGENPETAVTTALGGELESVLLTAQLGDVNTEEIKSRWELLMSD